MIKINLVAVVYEVGMLAYETRACVLNIRSNIKKNFFFVEIISPISLSVKNKNYHEKCLKKFATRNDLNCRSWHSWLKLTLTTWVV